MVYGPPTLMFEMIKLPSLSVIVPYSVPEGVCVTVTEAPSRASPLVSVTLPVILLVVTCACKVNPANKRNNNCKKSEFHKNFV